MQCARPHAFVPDATALYESKIDIELLKQSCFLKENSAAVQVLFVDVDRAKRGSALRLEDTPARFIIVYSAEHAAVISRSAEALLIFDPLGFTTDLSRYLIGHYEGRLPIKFADQEDTLLSHEAVVQLDSTSCLAICTVFVFLRLREELTHSATIRKLTKTLKPYQVREMALIILGLIDAVPT